MEFATEIACRQLDVCLANLSLPPLMQKAIMDLVVSLVAPRRYSGLQLPGRASPTDPHPTRPVARRSHREIAATFYKATVDRQELTGPDLLHDPVWLMMLDMFMAADDGRTNTVSSLCTASLVPPTTALRYITLMEQRGLLKRTQDQNDQRRIRIEPTERAVVAVAKIIDQVEDASHR